MKYMSWVLSTDEWGTPPQALMDAIDAAVKERSASGKMIDAGGLSTLRDGGAKITLQGGAIVDGPYSEAKELIGGYSIEYYDTLEDARAGAREFLELHRQHWPEWEGHVEIRQMYGPEDF